MQKTESSPPANLEANSSPDGDDDDNDDDDGDDDDNLEAHSSHGATSV